MKVVGIFKPYKIPLQGLVISNDNSDYSFKGNFKPSTPNSLGEFSFQNTKTEFSEKTEDKFGQKKKICQFRLKKRNRAKTPKKSCFKCKVEDCDLLFDSIEEMEDHLKTHENILKCEKEGCNLIFIKNENYLKHLKTHNISGKKYICPFPGCGKKFTASYNQKIHYRIHTGEKPYKCQKCGNEYYDRANYKYHLRTSHLVINSDDTQCCHPGCKHCFKTKKQKLMHHDKLEYECRNEKNIIVKMLSEFKKCFNSFYLEDKLELTEEGKKVFESLNGKIEETKEKVMDFSMFDAIFLKDQKA